MARLRAEDAEKRASSGHGPDFLEAFVRGPHRVRAEDLTEPNVMELPEWLVRLRENRLGSNAPAAPVVSGIITVMWLVSYERLSQTP